MKPAEHDKTIAFELVSPEARLMSGPVTMAVLPGEDGELGVGAGHTSLVVSLKEGVVSLHDGGGDPKRIFIAGGFADVTAERCTVLAEEAVNVSAMRKGDIEQDLRDLNDDLNNAKEDADRARIEKKIRMAKARLQAVTGVLQV